MSHLKSLVAEITEGYPYRSPYNDMSDDYVVIGINGIIPECEPLGSTRNYDEMLTRTKNSLSDYCMGKNRVILRDRPEFALRRGKYTSRLRLLADDGTKELRKHEAA